MTTDLVTWLDTAEPDAVTAAAGPKMGSLAELGRAGFGVPRGFAVTTAAYALHVGASGLDLLADRVLAGVRDPHRQEAVEAASARIRGAFEEVDVIEPVAAAVVECYGELCDRSSRPQVPAAVRSSATGEDSASASFAGVFDTHLGVSGSGRVVEAVRSCWASLFTGRAIRYRLEHGLSHRRTPMGVGVVELVNARSSGVAFSVHPVTGKRDRMVIEANWGWGEAVVRGLVTPDRVEVGKDDRRVLRHEVAAKEFLSVLDGRAGRVAEVPMPERLRKRAVLDEEEIGCVVDAVLAIERHYGHPVDVEWVIDRDRVPGGQVTIVQARPITVQPRSGTVAAWDPVAYAAKYAFGSGAGRPCR
ncbi:PEP/pyruvate-binding domain-containing protein [Streptomyces sp. NPDC052043]|uniref:PEP/pyruvate-binding domain-containing protein n=1 Tax=Streptomyces sp. NPDC052043 TaxID=3365684 RepID=UPI0037D0A9C1